MVWTSFARFLSAVCGIAIALLAVEPAAAHPLFKKAFKKNYDLGTVSCNTCRVKGQKKKVRGPFGKKIEKLLDGKNVTQRINDAKAKVKAARDDEKAEQKAKAAKKKVDNQIYKEFLEALKKLDQMKAPSGKKYSEAIPAGEIEGAKAK